MDGQAPPATMYRHVVFTEPITGFGPVVNFTPAGSAAAIMEKASLTAEDASFVRWIFDEAGLHFRHYKTETLSRRIPACLRSLRVASITQARALIQRQPQLLQVALSALIIGVTSFFRDAAVFAAFRERVIPELAKGLGDRTSALRAWSVGCSDGAELYSVAMLLGERGLLARSQLLGTDCRPDAIKQAAEGAFEPSAVQAVPRELLERYFEFNGSHWGARPELRNATRWRRANALAVHEPGEWDMILCRNMGIYLQPDAVGRLWARFETALRPGGFLVLGKAERPVGARSLSLFAPCIYRRDQD